MRINNPAIASLLHEALQALRVINIPDADNDDELSCAAQIPGVFAGKTVLVSINGDVGGKTIDVVFEGLENDQYLDVISSTNGWNNAYILDGRLYLSARVRDLYSYLRGVGLRPTVAHSSNDSAVSRSRAEGVLISAHCGYVFCVTVSGQAAREMDICPACTKIYGIAKQVALSLVARRLGLHVPGAKVPLSGLYETVDSDWRLARRFSLCEGDLFPDTQEAEIGFRPAAE